MKRTTSNNSRRVNRLYSAAVASLIVIAIGLLPITLRAEAPAATKSAVGESPLLVHAPADSVAILYSQDIAALGGDRLADDNVLPAGIGTLLRTLLEPVDREVMIAISGSPPNPFATRFTLAARTTMGQAELFNYVDQKLAPMLGGTSEDGGSEFWEADGIGHLTLNGTLTMAFEIAWRDNMYIVTNVLGQAPAFRSGDRSASLFLDTSDYARVKLDEPNSSVRHLLYVNMRPWVGLAQAELNDSLPKLYEATQLGRLQFVAFQQAETLIPVPPPAGEATAGKNSVQRGQETRTADKSDAAPSEPQFEVRHRQFMRLGLDELTTGPWRWIGSTPADAALAGSFPPETILYVGSGMKDGAEPWSNVKAFINTIAPEIIAEYETEREEFRRDVGFDPESEFLANLGDEWALGVTGGDTTGTLLALQLKSASTFRAQWHQLRTYFDLKTETSNHRDVVIEEALRPGSPFFFALADDVLLIAGDRKVIGRAIDAREDEKSLAQTERFRKTRERAMSRTASKLVYLNFTELLSDAYPAPDIDELPELKAALLDLQAMTVAVTPRNNALHFEWAWGAERDRSVAPMIVDAVVQSLQQARHQAKRTIAMANARNIVSACHIWASQNQNRWPGNLHDLAGSGILGTLKEAGKILANPYEPPDEVVRIQPWYLYRPIKDVQNAKLHEIPVICEPAVHDGGIVVGFGDGHTEWIESPRAEEILRSMQTDG